MIYLVIILSLALLGVLGYLGVKKYNEIHEKFEAQQQEIDEKRSELDTREGALATKEELLDQERHIFDLEKRVFLKSQEAKFNMEEMSEKEIAIELYSHFIQMENEFARYQRSLDKLDNKVANIKDYSDLMEGLTSTVCDQFTTYKDNLVSTNNAYVEKVSALQGDVNKTMDTLMTELEDLVQESANKTFANVNQDVQRILENTSEEVSQKVLQAMPESVSEQTIRSIVEETMEAGIKEYLVSILDEVQNGKETRSIPETVSEEPALFEEAAPVVEQEPLEVVEDPIEISAEPIEIVEEIEDPVLEVLS
ncbi:MAG: hypothetical protein KBT48_05455 [Firmicutes bacterium]|nr:hypothetical protein [Bacillota bacterium]